MKFLILILLAAPLTTFVACTSASDSTSLPTYDLSLSMTRIPQSGYNPFRVTVNVAQAGQPVSGQTLNLTLPKGSASAITDNGNGSYSFVVTPTATGVYPVTIAVGSSTLTRKAVVLDTYATGVGQPMAVPGDYVNTPGYEDGATITPDGQYLFVQYGPIYMSGVLDYLSVCSSSSYSVGYDLGTCAGRTNSSLVFNTIGSYSAPLRPNFPLGGIVNGSLQHLPGIQIAGAANGLVGFPTIFYGFKREADGTFAEPFKLAFDDDKAIQGPFGLSFKMNGDGTGTYIVAWNNYLNDPGGDHKPDIYTGQITFGRDNSMGTVTYNGDAYSAITPTVSLVNFSSHVGVQGNPHLYYDTSGTIKSIWTDDEQVTNDLSVYRLTAGTFPTGTWVKDTLPTPINTTASESQPFFTGTELIFRRESHIASHAYLPTNGACASTFTQSSCWGPENVLLGTNIHSNVGEIANMGEPTIATINGKRYLYFVYVEVRANNAITGLLDYNADVGFVDLP